MWWLCEGPIPAVGQKCPKELIPRGGTSPGKSHFVSLFSSVLLCFSLFVLLSWVFSKVLFKGSSLDPAMWMALKEDPGSPWGQGGEGGQYPIGSTWGRKGDSVKSPEKVNMVQHPTPQFLPLTTASEKSGEFFLQIPLGIKGLQVPCHFTLTEQPSLATFSSWPGLLRGEKEMVVTCHKYHNHTLE